MYICIFIQAHKRVITKEVARPTRKVGDDLCGSVNYEQ